MGPYQDTTANTAIIPEKWSARFFEVLRPTLPFIESVNYDYEEEITDLGDLVNISQIPDFSDATELAEGAAGDTDAVTVTGQQLTINKRTYKDFKVTKKAQLQSLSFVDSLEEKAVFAINKRMHQVIIDNIVPSAAAPDHQIAYDAATTLALADILEVKELLDAADVPMENRYMTLGSAQWNDLYNITGFTSRDFIPTGSPLSSGQFQTDILGFMPRMTTVVGNTAYFHHKSFLTVAMQQMLNVSVHDLGPSGIRALRTNSDILWGLKQLDNKRVVTLS